MTASLYRRYAHAEDILLRGSLPKLAAKEAQERPKPVEPKLAPVLTYTPQEVLQ